MNKSGVAQCYFINTSQFTSITSTIPVYMLRLETVQGMKRPSDVIIPNKEFIEKLF